MRFQSFILGALILISGCATQHPPLEIAQGPIGWGEPVNGLQVGLAPLLTQNPPGTLQSGAGELKGVVVYLRNFGQDPLTLVDPKPMSGPAAVASLWSIQTEPDHSAQVDSPRPDPARILTLTPGELTSFNVSLPMMPHGQGAHHLVAEYDNADSVINIVSTDARSPKSASGVWTGRAKSDTLLVNETP